MINLGFEIVEPETLSFADQVLMFMHAEYIVAPYSSALLNIIFSQTNIKLFILIQSRLYNFGSYYGALQALGYDMLFVTGEAEIDYKHASFHVPIERLSEALAIYA